jgi:hypothetical protein
MGRTRRTFKHVRVEAMVSGGRRLNEEEEREVRRELAELRQEHRDLDTAIQALAESPRPDFIQIQRMKKRKLVLKDRISVLDDRLLPDIIA